MASTMTVYDNNDKTYNVTFEDSNGDAIDITDCTLYFTVKNMENTTRVADSEALIHKTVTSHTDPANGKSRFTLTHDDLDIDDGTYYFDFQLVDEEGRVTTLQKGVFKVFTRVTSTV